MRDSGGDASLLQELSSSIKLCHGLGAEAVLRQHKLSAFNEPKPSNKRCQNKHLANHHRTPQPQPFHHDKARVPNINAAALSIFFNIVNTVDRSRAKTRCPQQVPILALSPPSNNGGLLISKVIETSQGPLHHPPLPPKRFFLNPPHSFGGAYVPHFAILQWQSANRT